MIKVELRSRSGYITLFNQLDIYMFFFHTSKFKSVSSLYSYRAQTLLRAHALINTHCML